MPKVSCKCGNVISLSEIPNPNEYLIISDNEFDSYPDLINHDGLYQNMKHILECNACKRLLIYWNGFNKTPQIYLPEKFD